MMTPTRVEIEAEIERLLSILEALDRPCAAKNRASIAVEAEVNWVSGIAPTWFVIAERARKNAAKKQ